jgi:hypothetical protein
MADKTTTSPKKTKSRSPNFPGINLQEAIGRARALYEKEGLTPTPQEVLFKHWDYAPKSSSALITLAALRAFGLVENEGGRIKLSELARDILQDERSESPDRVRAIHRAALTPKIHAELWKSFDEKLPSDENLRHELVRKRGFTPSGAEDFITQFRSTLAFARLPNDDKLGDEPEDGKGGSCGEVPPGVTLLTPKAETPGMNQDVFTLESGKVVLQYPAQLSRADFDDLKTWLGLMEKRIARAVKGEPEASSEKAD